MKTLLLLLGVMFSSVLASANDTVAILGPESLRQHIDPAQVQVERFLKFYDLGNDKSAKGLMWKTSQLNQTRSYLKKFGTFEARTLKSIRVADTYPPEADATFIIFTYDAAFSQKKSIAQKVVVRLSEQGKYEIAVFP